MPDFFIDGNPASQDNIGQVSIWFSAKQCDGNPGELMVDGYLSTSQVSKSKSTFVEAFRDTALAYFDVESSMSPINQPTLDSLATQFEQDYTNWRRITFDYSFSGILNFAQSGLVDTYEFDYGNSHQPCLTRIYTYPFNFGFHELGHYDYSGDCTESFDASPYRAYYGPPGVAQYNLSLVDGRLESEFVKFASLGGIEAIVTQQITACVGTKYGIGMAQIYHNVNGNGVPDPSFNGPVSVDSWWDTSIPVGTHVTISYRNGGWLLQGANC